MEEQHECFRSFATLVQGSDLFVDFLDVLDVAGSLFVAPAVTLLHRFVFLSYDGADARAIGTADLLISASPASTEVVEVNC